MVGGVYWRMGEPEDLSGSVMSPRGCHWVRDVCSRHKVTGDNDPSKYLNKSPIWKTKARFIESLFVSNIHVLYQDDWLLGGWMDITDIYPETNGSLANERKMPITLAFTVFSNPVLWDPQWVHIFAPSQLPELYLKGQEGAIVFLWMAYHGVRLETFWEPFMTDPR